LKTNWEKISEKKPVIQIVQLEVEEEKRAERRSGVEVHGDLLPSVAKSGEKKQRGG